MWFPMWFSKATVTRPAPRRPAGDPTATPKIIFFFIFFAPVCEAQTGNGANMRKKGQLSLSI